MNQSDKKKRIHSTVVKESLTVTCTDGNFLVHALLGPSTQVQNCHVIVFAHDHHLTAHDVTGGVEVPAPKHQICLLFDRTKKNLFDYELTLIECVNKSVNTLNFVLLFQRST